MNESSNLTMLLIFTIIATSLHFARPFPLLEDCQFLDLSYDLSNDTLYWDGNERFQLSVVNKGRVPPSGYFYEVNKFSAPEHGGTHFDAPSHFSENGTTADKVPISGFIGPACVVDVSGKVEKNPDYQLSIDDLNEWERRNGQLSKKCILIMRTGWEKKYGDKNQYFGTSTPLDKSSFHFPGLNPEAAEWLVTNNRLKAFGLDTPSTDHGQTKEFKTHQILSAHNVIGLENLMNLDKVPEIGATIVALPMKIKGGSGGPVRVIALGWQGANDPCFRNSDSAHVMHDL